MIRSPAEIRSLDWEMDSFGCVGGCGGLNRVRARMRKALGVLALLLSLVACGGDSADSPEQAVERYLAAIADGDGEKACELLTLRVRAEVSGAAGSRNCPAGVDELRTSLGEDAQRVKDTDVQLTVENERSAEVDATLAGRSVDIDLVKIDDAWRLDTLRLVHRLLGIPLSDDQ